LKMGCCGSSKNREGKHDWQQDEAPRRSPVVTDVQRHMVPQDLLKNCFMQGWLGHKKSMKLYCVIFDRDFYYLQEGWTAGDESKLLKMKPEELGARHIFCFDGCTITKEEDQNVFVFHTKKISSGTSEVLDGATYKFHAGDAEIMSKWLKAAEKAISLGPAPSPN